MRVLLKKTFHMKNQNRIENLLKPLSILEPASKLNVDNKFNDSSRTKNTAHVDVNDKNLDNVGFIKVNSLPAIGEHLTALFYVGNTVSNSVDDKTLLRWDANKKK